MKPRYYNHKVIQDYIKENGLTIKEFCDRCNIFYRQYVRILNDESVDIGALYRISKVLLIPFYKIFIVYDEEMFDGVELYK